MRSTCQGDDADSWQPGKKATAHSAQPGWRRAKAAASERLCAMSRSAKSWCEAGMWPLSTMSRRASRQTSPMARSFGHNVSHNPHSVQLSIMRLALRRPMTMLTLL